MNRTSVKRRSLAALALVSVLATTSVARADAPAPTPTPSPATAATAKQAEEHFQRGIKLFDDGDFKLALVEFERSYELVPNYRVLYNVGAVQYQLSHYAQAYRTLSRYLETGGERITPNRRAEVEKDIESLKIRTAHLRITVDVEGASVLVDGEHIGRSPLGEAELVDAGPHRITAQKTGFNATTESVTLVGGDSREVTVRLTPIPPPPGPIVEVRETPGLGPVWIGWGLAVALGAATVGTGVAWQNADARLTDLKNAESSPTERQSEARSVDTLQTATWALGAAALVTAGVSLYFTLRRSTVQPSTRRPSSGNRAGFVVAF